MNKILLGLSILLSVVLLSGCGSGSKGSAGADGAAGATGATGATGASGAAGTAAGLTSILLPDADSDLAITIVDNDTDFDLGQNNRSFTVSGTDNLSADSRLRYYGYMGAGSTSKTVVATVINMLPSGPGTSWPLDSRQKSQDNFTLQSTANAVFGGEGAFTHLIICPGNDAGDATACASALLNDRGAGSESNLSELDTELVMAYALTSGFGFLRDNGSSAHVRVEPVTHAKTGGVSGGTASTVIAVGKTEAATMQGFDMISSGGTTAYFIAPAAGDNDNFSLTSITSSGTSTSYITNITNKSNALGATDTGIWGSSHIRISEGSDGVYGTVMWTDNATVSAFKFSSGTATVHGTDNLSIGAATTNAVHYAPGTARAQCSAVHPASGRMSFVFTASDNLSTFVASQPSGGAWSTISVVKTRATTDNQSTACDIVYNAEGVGFLATVADNGSTIEPYISNDNGSSWTLISSPEGSALLDIGGDVVDLAMTIDTDLGLPVVVANAAGRVVLWGMDNATASAYGWSNYIPYGTANSITTAGSRVSIASLADGTAFMLGYESAANDNATLRVFYDE